LKWPPNSVRFIRLSGYIDGPMSIFHGPRKLADYDENGKLKTKKKAKVA